MESTIESILAWFFRGQYPWESITNTWVSMGIDAVALVLAIYAIFVLPRRVPGKLKRIALAGFLVLVSVTLLVGFLAFSIWFNSYFRQYVFVPATLSYAYGGSGGTVVLPVVMRREREIGSEEWSEWKYDYTDAIHDRTKEMQQGIQ